MKLRIALSAMMLCSAVHADSLSGVIDKKTDATAPSAEPQPIAINRDGLTPNDVAGRMQLARQARDAKQWQMMADLAREVLKIDPESRPAYDLLLMYDREVPIPLDGAAAEDLKTDIASRFKQAFYVRATSHFMIVYDTPETFTRERGAFLEKAYQSFMYWFNMKKLRPELLKERLPIVLFKQRAHYLQYAKAVDGDELAWTAGYYSQRTNRATFYDDSTSDQVEKVDDKLDEYRIKMRNMTIAIENARRAGNSQLAAQISRDQAALSDAIRRVEHRVGNIVGKINTLKTVHEAIHQLAFNTGIQKRLVDYPLWLAEGIACSFEADDANGARGPGTLNPVRLSELKDLQTKKALLTWEEVVRGPQGKIESDTIGKYYAQSWLLFHYLYKFKRNGVEDLLIKYNNTPIMRQVDHAKYFQECMDSDPVDFKDDINKYLEGLPTPRRF